MLVALFERTYDNMTPAARRVFQTLCNWRTNIPRIAIEAILVRHQNEYMNVPKAIDELYRFSLIDLIKNEIDGHEFISLPLSSFEFGRKKLSVSSMKSAIEVDTIYIRMFGTTNEYEIKKGIGPKVEKFFNEISKKNLLNKTNFSEEYRPILILICGNYNPAWLLLSRIHEELNEYLKAKEALQNFISNETDDKKKLLAWDKISVYCRIMKDWLGEAHSYIEMCEFSVIDFNKLSQCSANLLRLLTENKIKIDSNEKTILVRKMSTLLESRIEEGDLDSRTTLAWLYMNLGDLQSAKKVTKHILNQDKNHVHAIKLAKKLKIRKK
jgi:tetratricopeptide (TPR) repeat protein